MDWNASLGQPLPSFSGCFVCGIDNNSGLKLKFFQKNDSVSAFFSPSKTHLGYGHAVHGGIISSLLDEAIVWAVYAATSRFGVTAELNVRFLKPVLLNEKYIVEGRLINNKGKIWQAEAVLMDAKSISYAKGIGKIFPLSEIQNETIKMNLLLEND